MSVCALMTALTLVCLFFNKRSYNFRQCFSAVGLQKEGHLAHKNCGVLVWLSV